MTQSKRQVKNQGGTARQPPLTKTHTCAYIHTYDRRIRIAKWRGVCKLQSAHVRHLATQMQSAPSAGVRERERETAMLGWKSPRRHDKHTHTQTHLCRCISLCAYKYACVCVCVCVGEGLPNKQEIKMLYALPLPHGCWSSFRSVFCWHCQLCCRCSCSNGYGIGCSCSASF